MLVCISMTESIVASQYLLRNNCARHCYKHFTLLAYLISIAVCEVSNLYNGSIRCYYYPHFTEKQTDKWKLNSFPKVIQLEPRFNTWQSRSRISLLITTFQYLSQILFFFFLTSENYYSVLRCVEINILALLAFSGSPWSFHFISSYDIQC